MNKGEKLFTIHIFAIAFLIFGYALLQAYYRDWLAKDADILVHVMVDRTYGNPLASGKIGTYYWAIIEGPHYVSTGSESWFNVSYHLVGCPHNIDFRKNSTTEIGYERICIDASKGSIKILVDKLSEFDTHYTVARKMLKQIELGGKTKW